MKVIREKGYNATSVDDLCRHAGVTKGAFFHHFRSKEDLAVGAAQHWSEVTGALFRSAPYHEPDNPLDRLLAYIDFRKQLVRGDVPAFTCLVGTMVQETYQSSPAVRDACRESIFGHAATLVADIEAAMVQHGGDFPVTAESLARHTQTVIQGAFVLTKAANDPAMALESIDHLRRYIELLFAPARPALAPPVDKSQAMTPHMTPTEKTTTKNE